MSQTPADLKHISQKAVPLVDLKAQYRSIRHELHSAVDAVLSNCNFILGKPVNDFEEAFARFVHAKYGVGVSSGLDALRLALVALGVGPGDEVILPVNTYIATALAVSAVGATPVLVDCDPFTYNIDPPKIEAAITSRTKALIPVHFTGQSADMDPILDIAAHYGLIVVEDAAQAHGTTYRGRHCGSMGHAACFSFYPGKNLGAAGDGGLITTNDEGVANRLRKLRNYGEAKKYDHVEKGLNARLDTLQAAILNVKLPYLAAWNCSRAAHAARYRDLLKGVNDIRFQNLVPESTHIYHLFMIETSQRDDLRSFLSDCGVQTGIHYPTPIHLQRAYAELGYKIGDFPNAEKLAGRILSLPMYAELTDEQIAYVCAQVQAFPAAHS